jgi:hypothetical protein
MLKNITLIFPCLSVLELAIKKFSNLPSLIVDHKTPISEGVLSILKWKECCTERQQESEQTSLAGFPYSVYYH